MESMDDWDVDPTQGLPVVSPANMLPVQVIHREEIASDVVSILIVLPGTKQAPAPYLPGQFVTLSLPTPRETLYRSYSLCGDGDASHPWELTIKRMQQGTVSNYFYNSVGENTLLYSSLPRGTFTLPAPTRPEMAFVFVAVGSGITPIMGMLRAIAKMPLEQRPLAQLHYASRAVVDIIFLEELQEMDPDRMWLRQWHYLSSEGDRLTPEAVLESAGRMTPKAHWYICGPDKLKHQLQAKLAKQHVPAARVHSEIFASQPRPAYRVDERASNGGSLRIVETKAQLDVQPQETLLAALERHGYRPEFSCRVGTCGTCTLRVVEGQADPVGEALSEAERKAGYVLSCIARPIGEITLASGGRPPAGVARVAPGMAGAGVRGGAVTRVRMAALVSVGALALGAWSLTNHQPASWASASTASAPATQTAPPGSTSTSGTTPGTTPGATTTGGGGGVPTATVGTGGGPVPTAAGGGPAPAPTTAAAPTATPKPKPAPTATSTPSKKA